MWNSRTIFVLLGAGILAFGIFQPVLAADSSLRIPILVYHGVFPDHPGQTEEQRKYQVTPEQLDAQLAYLEENRYSPVTLGEAIEAIEEGTTTEKLVAITFDDGWWNQYAYGLPVLAKYHVHATFFIYPNPIGRSELFMDWNQVRTLAAHGMEIGSHTLMHPELSLLSTDDLQKQVSLSKEKLESEIERPVTLFASPYGFTSPELTRLLREDGYKANRLLGGSDMSSSTDLYALKGFLATRDMERFFQIIQAR